MDRLLARGCRLAAFVVKRLCDGLSGRGGLEFQWERGQSGRNSPQILSNLLSVTAKARAINALQFRGNSVDRLRAFDGWLGHGTDSPEGLLSWSSAPSEGSILGNSARVDRRGNNARAGCSRGGETTG